MYKELVSVIMPVFNAERWLGDSIESALGQTWDSLELIVIDDGSADSSVAVAERYVGPRVTLIRQENRGASVARNAGLAIARGDYVQYLDADDRLDPRKIALQVAALGGAAGRVASAGWGRFSDSDPHAQFEPDSLWRDFRPLDFLVTAYRENVFMPNHAWLTPRAIADRAGRWPARRARNDDAEYFAKVVIASGGVTFVPGARVYYRSGHVGLSAARDRESIEGYLSTLDEISRHLLDAEDSARTREALAVSYDHFVSQVEATAPDLAERAEGDIRRLVGGRFRSPQARAPIALLTWLIGRDGVRGLRRVYRESLKRATGDSGATQRR